MTIKRTHTYFVLAVCICLTTVYLSGCTSLKPRYEAEEDDSSASGAEEDRASSGLTPTKSYTSNATGGINKNHLDSDGGAGRDTHCIEEGALRCVASVRAEREVCLDGSWVASDPCDDGEICDDSDLDDPGSCLDESLLCLGSAGQFICNGDTMFECDENEVAVHQEPCRSRQHCLAGLASGMCAECIPEQEYFCDDRDLMVCAEDGIEFALYQECPSADACNDELGVCDAVGECDFNSDCGEAQECRKAICEKGQCTTGIDEGSACGDEKEGVCDASGECVECVDDDDCRESTPYCNTETNECVECVENSHCKDKEEGKPDCDTETNECVYVPRCGNGVTDPGEQCDDGDNDNNDGCPNNCRFKMCDPSLNVMCALSSYYYYPELCLCPGGERCVWNMEYYPEKWVCMLPCDHEGETNPSECEGQFGRQENGEFWPTQCKFGVCVITCDDGCPEGTMCKSGNIDWIYDDWGIESGYGDNNYKNCGI